MRDDIISYREMCDREKVQTLQRGMNFRLNSNYSIILMSQRKNAPYKDRILNEGTLLEYEGHDASKTPTLVKPKDVDQTRYSSAGKLTQNGYFAEATEKYKAGQSSPEKVKVYEKILPGVWSDKGFFNLVDYKFVHDGKRSVFKFYLEPTEEKIPKQPHSIETKERKRIIPSEVKKEVWRRDGGKCVICGAKAELHFDHDLPFSKGGASITVDNVRILCARHNIQKSDKIE